MALDLEQTVTQRWERKKWGWGEQDFEGPERKLSAAVQTRGCLGCCTLQGNGLTCEGRGSGPVLIRGQHQELRWLLDGRVCPVGAVWPQVSPSTPLCLHFFIYKIKDDNTYLAEFSWTLNSKVLSVGVVRQPCYGCSFRRQRPLRVQGTTGLSRGAGLSSERECRVQEGNHHTNYTKKKKKNQKSRVAPEQEIQSIRWSQV